jgi:hypothetical protein
MDFIAAMFIFVLILLLFFSVRPNIESQNTSKLKDMQYEAKTLADSLATKGYPYNWTQANVERIGITGAGNSISDDKLSAFKSLTDSNYTRVKGLFSMRSDWCVFFLDGPDSASVAGIRIIGHPNATISGQKATLSGIEYSDLVSLSRIMYHNGSSVRMVVYAWQ